MSVEEKRPKYAKTYPEAYAISQKLKQKSFGIVTFLQTSFIFIVFCSTENVPNVLSFIENEIKQMSQLIIVYIYFTSFNVSSADFFSKSR